MSAKAPGTKGGPSLNPKGRPVKQRKDIQRADGEWYSAYTGLGVVGKDKRLGGGFALETVTDMEATDLWRGDDLAAKVIETLPDEMLRQGFEIRIAEPKSKTAAPGQQRLPGEPGTPGAPDETYGEAAARGDTDGWYARRKQRRDVDDQHSKLAEDVSGKLEDLGFAEAAFRGLCYERAYGGAAILLGVKDGSQPNKPLRPDAVRSLDWMTTLEPRECQVTKWYDDVFAPKFGQPEHYQINPVSEGDYSSTTIEVHESRLIVFGGARVTRRSMFGSLPGWGDSVLTRMIRILRDFNMSWSAAAVLLQDFSQTVIGIKDLHEVMASGNATKLKQRFQQIELGRSIANAVLIDAENEVFERKTTTLTGLHELLDKMGARLAAACDMPLTRLMGTSPGGLNATGDSDVRGWYDRVSSHQDRKLRPVLERLVKLLFKVLGSAEPDSWSVYFKPLWQPTDLERAQTMLAMAQVDEKNIASQVVSPEEVAKSRYGTDCYSLETIVDWDAREAAEPMAPPPAKTEQQLADEQHQKDLAIKALDIKQSGVDAKATKLPPAK